MATLNLSLPDQLRHWITRQIKLGRYASASDYLRDLIREDIRHQENEMQWLSDYLKPLTETPDEKFISVDAENVKSRARRRIKE